MRCSKAGNQLVWQYNGEKLVITPWGDNSFRVRSVMMGDIQNTDYALLEQPDLSTQIEVSEKRSSITNGKIKAVIEDSEWVPTGRISFYNQDNKLLLRETGYQGALNIIARKFKPIIGGDYRLTMTFDSNPDEKLYGMGQYQQEILDIKNCSFELAHRNSQASVPFVLSSLGYGLLWHNPAIGRVSFARNVTQWYAESTKQLDYWITAGDSPGEIEENYAKVTGTVPMMPEYGLGFWQCKLRYYTQEQLLNVAREYKRRNLPIDVIVIDFFHWPKMGDFRLDPEFFPDPQAMLDELNSLGIELMVSVWPTIALDSENFEEMKAKGLLIKPEMGVNISMQFGGDSVFFDATNPESRKYVWEKCKKNYFEFGVRIFWLDEAEPEYTIYDFDNYRYYMGIAGIPWWTTDIGGFHGGDPNSADFRELLVRWFQFGAFSPVMRLHGDRKPQRNLYHADGRPALFTGSDNEVWSFGQEAYEILQKYMALREKMRPYVRNLMRQAHEKGTPVMRPMFYEFPEDKVCWDLKDQYMFGGDILVAPVVYKGATGREVYLPPDNEWVEMHSGRSYKGGQTINCQAPIDIIPVFLKNGGPAELIKAI